jgi:pyruvate, water dikinase
MKFVKSFKELNKKDVNMAGGKGASLGEMTNAKIPVPPGFVILSNAFEYFLKENRLNKEIETILKKINHREIKEVEKASEKVREIILAGKIPKDILIEIKDTFKKLNSKYVAVRSSATAEDGALHAWAGQLDSYLNTTSRTLENNIKKCFASLFTPRAIFYRFEKGLNDSFISLAVVVQKMVNSEKAGVAFSVHPVTENKNQIIIEGSWGLGEAIVSGQVTPDGYVIEKKPKNILDVNLAEKSRGLFRKENGGNVWKNLPSKKANVQCLSNKEILKLSEIILQIEKHYGFPCDIEWAYEKDKFYITQSRPITTLKKK